jgi:hypothetical protein
MTGTILAGVVGLVIKGFFVEGRKHLQRFFY